MGGHGILRRRERPYVHMVNVGNSGNIENCLLDFRNAQIGRYSVEIHANRFFEQVHDAPYHHEGDDDRNDRINHRISGKIYDSPSDGDTERNECVAKKVEVC